MNRRRKISDLGKFHREVTLKGLTYAQAQIRETCEMIGPIKIPRDDEIQYRKR